MKSNIDDEYRKILNDIDVNLKNKSDVEYSKSQVEKLALLFIKEIEYISKGYQAKLNELEKKQEKFETSMRKMQETLNSIEQDIYDGDVDEDTFEFEIKCPYCNNDFIAEIDDVKEEIQCPECKNIIELDWNHSCDDDCSGDCSCCDAYDNEENDEDDDM